MWSQDWEGIAQERGRTWDAAVRQRQLHALVPSKHRVWRRRTGGWLVRVGRWLTQWGQEMAEVDGAAGVSIVS